MRALIAVAATTRVPSAETKTSSANALRSSTPARIAPKTFLTLSGPGSAKGLWFTQPGATISSKRDTSWLDTISANRWPSLT
jgi:hypothetical protein